MIRALLFDLDDTLLGNEMGGFFAEYIRLLAPHMAAWIPPEKLFGLIWRGGEAMMANCDPSRTTLDCFCQALEAEGIPVEACMPAFDEFYATDFQRLRDYVQVVPTARPLLEWALGQGYDVVIATNPMFPETAIRQRLEWAGIGDLPYVLITSCENMHHAKPNPLYYREILRKIGREPDECVMIGNDLRLDMAAREVGIQTYWITDQLPTPEIAQKVDAYGTLEEVRSWLAKTQEREVFQ